MSENNNSTSPHFNPKIFTLIGLPIIILAAFLLLPKKDTSSGATAFSVVGSWYASNSTKGRIPFEIRADGTATDILGLENTWTLQGETLTLTSTTIEGRTTTYSYNSGVDQLKDESGVIYFTTLESAAAAYQELWGDMGSSETDSYRDTRSLPTFHYYSIEDNSWTLDLTGPGAELFHDGELVDEFSAEDWTWYQTMYDMTMEGHPTSGQTIYLYFGEAATAMLDAEDGWFLAVRGLEDGVPTLYTSNPVYAD